jgi:hypothetical protein
VFCDFMTNGYEATIIYRSPGAALVNNHAQTLHRRVLRMRKNHGGVFACWTYRGGRAGGKQQNPAQLTGPVNRLASRISAAS